VNKALASRDAKDTRPVVIMPQDEGRFGRISDPKPAWAPPGVRPIAPRQIVREYVYAYAAVAPAIGKMTSLILPYANSDMMNIFLKEVAEEFSDFFVVMLVDQAGWHTTKNLKIPENIRLIEQPSHSPELNPAEHIWDTVREGEFHNAAFDSIEEVQDTLCRELVKLHDDPDRLRSLTNFPYLKCDHFLNEGPLEVLI
jgi:hypothetical protein